ncbi:MAG: hypothetical protein ABJP45_08075 [Cyclobacteriaceae bacterium]
MKTDYNYELIKDCLDGILDTKTTARIKDLIDKDETARDIAKGILLLDKRYGNDEDLDAYLFNLHTKQRRVIDRMFQPKRSISFLKIAASISILIVAALVAYQLNKPTLSDLVTAELSIPYQSPTTVRNSEEISDFDLAMIAYSKGEYARTFELLDEESNSQAIFFKGLSKLFMAEYSSASEYFNKPQLLESRYEEQSRWYLTLAYIKSHQIFKAQETLDFITSDNTHFKYSEALKMKELLNGN